MGSDEERLEEMLKAVLEEENKRAAQNAQSTADEEELPEIPEVPAEDFAEELPEIPEIPTEDFAEELPELPEIPTEDFAEELSEMTGEDFSEEQSEMPGGDFSEELPEMSGEDFSEELPEIPTEDFSEEQSEMSAGDFSEELPEIESEDFAEELSEIPERAPRERQASAAKEKSVDPLKLLAMSEEEIDKVLEEEAALGEMFTGKRKEGEQPVQPEGKDALSDIEEMLQMSDDHVLVDENGMGKDKPVRMEETESGDGQDFLGAFSGGGGENEQPADDGKQKKGRKKKKDKKEEESGEKKEGLGKKIAALFFSSDEDELEEADVKEKGKGKGKSASAGDDGEIKEKKEKKKKAPKKEKEKDPAKAAAKAAKEKRQKEKKAEKAKQKAAKAEQAEKEKRAAKKLPKKRVIVWALLCASIGAGILLINSIGMSAIQMTQARDAFYDKDFATAYKLLNGRELSAEDQLIFGQASAVLHLEHAEETYENHLKMKKSVKALEDLLKGVDKYQKLLQTEELITPELTAEYQKVLALLQEHYGLSEAGALEINGIESDYEYSLQLEAIANGEIYQSQSEAEMQQEEKAALYPELEDMLPEEEEFFNDSSD